jgi:hypothetical protein
MSKSQFDPLMIDARPTKELFIAMLTRDVTLIPAIIDLVDNCTDGARRLRSNRSWEGLEVKLNVSKDKFELYDNCGGMTAQTARQYAFRFGRGDKAPTTKGEVGRFGVGMKRGLFKLGRHFQIESTTKKTYFKVTIDVNKWAKDPDWEFHFDNVPIENGNFASDKWGTKIIVTQLHSEVSEHFIENNFIGQLRSQLTSMLEVPICNGLAVTVNSGSLKAHVRMLVSSDILAPARREITVPGKNGKVSVNLWCGLGKPEFKNETRAEAGWYVFCNGRMLLKADKTPATGWGIEDDESIPAFHPQFNDFRGLAYLDAADAADLPWNTTKTALDVDHPVYRKVKQEMMAITRPVINYLNKRKEENEWRKKQEIDSPGKLQQLFNDAEVAPLDEIKTRHTFEFPTPRLIIPKITKRNTQQICCFPDVKKANEVKKHMSASSWKEVGEQLFDYYYNSEIGNE